MVNNNTDDDEEPMHYCSGCAVQLVQQGFKVEAIDGDGAQQDDYDSNPLLGRIADLNQRLSGKRDRMKKSKDAYIQ